MSWRAIHNVVQGKEHIFLFLNTKDALILPARRFASPQEMQHFFQTAQSLWEKSRGIEIKSPLPDPRDS